MAGKYPKGVEEEDAAFRAALRKVQKFSIPKKNVVVNNDIWSILKVTFKYVFLKLWKEFNHCKSIWLYFLIGR